MKRNRKKGGMQTYRSVDVIGREGDGFTIRAPPLGVPLGLRTRAVRGGVRLTFEVRLYGEKKNQAKHKTNKRK
jgi:hypothetical protein